MIERLYPGVFVTEVPFAAKPIDGVSTSTAGESRYPGVFVEEVPFKAKSIDGVSTSVDAPEWTDHNQRDPGVTLLQLFAWIPEAVLYDSGVVSGLGVEASNTAQAPRVSVSPGLALGPDGRGIECQSAAITHRDPEP